jgi:hypothetical protein
MGIVAWAHQNADFVVKVTYIPLFNVPWLVQRVLYRVVSGDEQRVLGCGTMAQSRKVNWMRYWTTSNVDRPALSSGEPR